MNKSDLQEKATSLGIDTEGLTVEQLKSAIAEKETEIALTNAAEEAKELGINPEGIPLAALLAFIVATKERNEAVEKLSKIPDPSSEAAAESEEQKPVVVEKDTRPVFTDGRKQKYAFKKKAPENLNIEGVIMPIAEIIEDEEIMLELILGNSSFVEPIK